ncbi:MAG: isoamylase early set domain-containing protein [Chloroflexi bacterium]|nr:isoamylase early set domain-containing protein [Chloroflexota bacterium]
MITKQPGSSPNTVRITFSIPSHLWATEVHLVGDFNNWDRRSLPLEHTMHDGWRINLELPRGRAYQYRYLLDGAKWCNDCNADGYISNVFGGVNSVIET